MNFKPNFEQFKQDQKKLEQIPPINPEFYFVLNDISKKIISNEELTEKEINDLEIIHDVAQDIEKQLINIIDNYRSENIITKNEFLVSVDYFLTAHHNGPDNNDLKFALMKKGVLSEDVFEFLDKKSIPEHLRNVLKIVCKKIQTK